MYSIIVKNCDNLHLMSINALRNNIFSKLDGALLTQTAATREMRMAEVSNRQL